jgi:hypothetical protein
MVRRYAERDLLFSSRRTSFGVPRVDGEVGDRVPTGTLATRSTQLSIWRQKLGLHIGLHLLMSGRFWMDGHEEVRMHRQRGPHGENIRQVGAHVVFCVSPSVSGRRDARDESKMNHHGSGWCMWYGSAAGNLVALISLVARFPSRTAKKSDTQ